jgi:hypothetical protein
MKSGSVRTVALIDSAISTVCSLLLSGTYNNACNKAADATTTKIGIKQEDIKDEDIFQKYMLNQSYKLVGKETVYTAGAGVYLYKIYSDKKVTIEIPNLGFCDSMHSDLSMTNYTLQFKWSFK